MGCDLVVALGQATVNGHGLFGLNCHGPRMQWPLLRRLAGQDHPPGTIVRLGEHELPQARQTSTVVGLGARGHWGFTAGMNEHQLAVGVAGWTSKVVASRPALQGTDLVRLTLERSHSVRQAVDVLSDLITRHGQGQPDVSEGRDHIFLIADPREAAVLEAAGSYWAAVNCQQVRAVSDTALIRQDWQRLAPGLAEQAMAQSWWRDDGSKIDFSGSLGAHPPSQRQALKRWGRATVLLEQQNGHIDLWFLRRLLADHFEGVVRRAPVGKGQVGPSLGAAFLAELSPEPDAVPLAWIALGAPEQAFYVPILLDGEPPAILDADNVVGAGFLRLPAELDKALDTRDDLDKWQARLDQQTEDFMVQARLLKRQGNQGQLQRQATLFMQQALGDSEAMSALDLERLRRPAPAEDLAYIAE